MTSELQLTNLGAVYLGGEDVDASQELAAELGMDVDVLVELLGADWRRVSSHEPLSLTDAAGPWWQTGDPVQLMLSADRSSRQLILALPRGEWRGLAELVYVPTRPSLLRLDESPEVIHAAAVNLLRARRSSFRYCRYCRSLTPPEYRDEPDVCMGCSERWLGVVH